MHVTIDAAPLLFRSAGIKNYLYHWIRHLKKESGSAEIRLFPFLREPHSLDHEGSVASRPGTFLRLGLLYGLNHAPSHASCWAAGRPDIFHACKLLHPPRGAKLTATAHDFTCWLLPETHKPENVATEKVFAERILRCADGVIADSENTRQDAVRILGLAPEKVQVIYLGVADEYFAVTPEEAAGVRSRLGLPRPYLLYLGTIEPRKNVDLLLDAYRRLAAGTREEFQLVVAGPAGWASPKTMARLQTTPGVRYLGYVAERELPGLVAGATAFVYPSLYEGFGFPVAQAIAAGTPVITSAVSSLPEITAGAAVLVDPRSESELAGAIGELLTSSTRRAALSKCGRVQARRFSWSEYARRSLAFFEKVLGHDSGRRP